MRSLKRQKSVKQYQDIINLATLCRLDRVSWISGSGKTKLAVRTARDSSIFTLA
jgi:hypothetical protein